MVDWNLIFTGLTGVSTLAMAVIAMLALGSWKKEKIHDSKINFLANLTALKESLDNFASNEKLPLLTYKAFLLKISTEDNNMLEKEVAKFATDTYELATNLNKNKYIIYFLLKDKYQNTFNDNIQCIFKYKYSTERLAATFAYGNDELLKEIAEEVIEYKTKCDVAIQQIIELVNKELN